MSLLWQILSEISRFKKPCNFIHIKKICESYRVFNRYLQKNFIPRTYQAGKHSQIQSLTSRKWEDFKSALQDSYQRDYITLPGMDRVCSIFRQESKHSSRFYVEEPKSVPKALKRIAYISRTHSMMEYSAAIWDPYLKITTLGTASEELDAAWLR